ncbi:RNA-binding S4 domain-containing protein [Cognaticolwellia mytili]|uniref:RNA-binding S4 domain-containing protein n=1 Tax=Cognaticolwellia mytili TaxID=1888913 RepID=UPI000A16D893|nr:RNA-binding S4 domain-containing protein [Cognaticolwellia mytili]
MPTDIPLIDISVQPIELCKLLKIANMVGGGGEAKIVISEGYVLVNNEVEFQKRKKVYQDDIIEFNGEIVQVNVNKSQKKLSESPVIAKQAMSHKSKVKDKKKQTSTFQSLPNDTVQIEQPRSKRKPISF